MQETKPGRSRERPAKEWHVFCERAVCVSELENWQCEVPELSNVASGLFEVDRGFVSWRSKAPRRMIPATSRLFRALS